MINYAGFVVAERISIRTSPSLYAEQIDADADVSSAEFELSDRMHGGGRLSWGVFRAIAGAP